MELSAEKPKKTELFVTKRSGEKELVMPEKIMERLRKLAFETGECLNKEFIKIDTVVDKVVEGMYAGVTTEKLDDLCAETCAYMNIVHPDYSKLAARIAVSNLHKETKNSFAEIATQLRDYKDINNNPAPLLAEDVYQIIQENAARLEEAIQYERDFNYDFFGFKTLEKSYLLKVNGRIAERPQHMLMRVSIGIHKTDIDAAIQTYNFMSEKWFTHATPTLFNSGTPCPQMSSCFLLNIQGDSIEGIYDTLKQTAQISKSAGGIGISISKIRASGSYIRGTNGTSNGIVPMLRVFNDTARYVDQGGGKRKGSFAMYLEPWHADVFEFLNLRKNHGKEEQRARDLFFGLWTPDLFMERVESNGDWTLMCPNECPGLEDCWGEEFNELYTRYEKEGRGRKTIKAQELWHAIVDSQTETGTPYMCYKDQANRKSNQQNLGTIKSSNLCTEIIEYTAPNEVAVCNLASINLQKFVKEDRTYDYDRLFEVAMIVTKNLNKVIDLNYYPVKEARYSNMRNRPVGIGVQGMADAFMKMRVNFESQEALDINEKIFETIYFAAMTASKDLAKEVGPYEMYEGSPVSKGIFQFDMWNHTPRFGYDWDGLKAEVAKYGVRNSLLVAPMPTASTSQILGNNESFEPYTSNIFTRRVLSGEFVVLNPHLVKDMMALKLWNNDIKNQIIANNGSVQGIKKIPQDLQDIYKTVWEIKQKTLIDLARARAPFIDQSQSLNVFMADPSYGKLSSMHFYGWKAGLKTGMYYLRARPAADAIKFTVDVESLLKANNCDIKAKKTGLKDATNKSTGSGSKKRKIEFKKPTKEEIKAMCDNYDEENDMCLSCGS